MDQPELMDTFFFVFLLQNISSADCGVTKVCFSQPSNCDPNASADCYFMSAMMLSPRDPVFHYEMKGPSDGYISFGFSDDQMMVMLRKKRLDFNEVFIVL